MSDMLELKAIELTPGTPLPPSTTAAMPRRAREGACPWCVYRRHGLNVGLGIVHSMAHPLALFTTRPTALANVLLLPHVMEYNAASDAAPKIPRHRPRHGVSISTEWSVGEACCCRREGCARPLR